MTILHLYRKPALSLSKRNELLSVAQQKVSPDIKDIETEYCFNIETITPFTDEELNIVRWLLAETFEPENFSERSFLIGNAEYSPPTHSSPSRWGG